MDQLEFRQCMNRNSKKKRKNIEEKETWLDIINDVM